MPATAQPPTLSASRLPFRHDDLFQEAAYQDGQPYARDDEDEEE